MVQRLMAGFSNSAAGFGQSCQLWSSPTLHFGGWAGLTDGSGTRYCESSFRRAASANDSTNEPAGDGLSGDNTPQSVLEHENRTAADIPTRRAHAPRSPLPQSAKCLVVKFPATTSQFHSHAGRRCPRLCPVHRIDPSFNSTGRLPSTWRVLARDTSLSTGVRQLRPGPSIDNYSYTFIDI